MMQLSRRHMLIGGVFGLVSVAWTIDTLTGGAGPSSADAALSPTVATESSARLPDPPDLDRVIRALRNDDATRGPLPFGEATRDLFVPTPWMETALASASGASPLPTEPSAEPHPFDARHELQGILTGRVPLALIDGRLCRQGAEIDGYRLVELHRDYVVFERDESRVVLRVATAGRSE
jgi:hypothetical protein